MKPKPIKLCVPELLSRGWKGNADRSAYMRDCGEWGVIQHVVRNPEPHDLLWDYEDDQGRFKEGFLLEVLLFAEKHKKP